MSQKAAKPIKVLIVDDSRVTRDLLAHIIGGAKGIEVFGVANDGQSALELLASAVQRPDVVVMDIHMPNLDGFETTRRIMETQPLPIIICTATADPQELAIAFRSMEAGAVACIEKPVSPTSPDFAARSENLLQNVRLMSEVKVVRRWPRPRLAVAGGAAPQTRPNEAARFVGIGASTGGPPVLQTVLSSLPKDFPVPLLIVQHIARGFLPGLVEWLNETTSLHVHIAAHAAVALPGHAYIAPDDFHLGVSAGNRLLLAREEAESGLRPAVSYLFRSLAQTCGGNVIGVLLTGMGKDGAQELKQLKDLGAFTIAQDRDSSVVHGMPGAAIALGAATQVLSADRIAGALIAQIRQKATAAGGVEG
jgi:two-component system chemotaxis response regulator CheB